MTVTAELLAVWTEAWSTHHAGWDFADVAPGMGESPTPWDVEDECVRVMRDASSVLDMGTGGGEQLLRLLDAAGTSSARTRVVATEGRPPNVPVARAALEPRGVVVVEHDADRGLPLPLADASVDLVTNRHEAYDAGRDRPRVSISREPPTFGSMERALRCVRPQGPRASAPSTGRPCGCESRRTGKGKAREV